MSDVRAGHFELVVEGTPELSLQALRGIGPKTAERLLSRDIDDQLELLLELPRTYRHTHRYVPVDELLDRRPSYVEHAGRVADVGPPNRRNRRPFAVDVQVDGTTFELLWFNLPYPGFADKFEPGRWVTFEGDVDWENGSPTLSHPTVDRHERRPEPAPSLAEVEPVYRSMEGIADARLRDAIEQAADRLFDDLVDVVPDDLRRARELPTVSAALKTLHVLDGVDDLEAFRERLGRARHRLVYEEFYTLQRQLAEEYARHRRAASAPVCEERDLGREFVRSLPFELTGDQKRACARLADDLGRRTPMRRLLQGDVGSGKTVVALAMAAIVVDSGRQVAFMAPTEILARQHRRRIGELFDELDLDASLLVGSLSNSEARRVRKAASSGRTDVVVGTHALFQEDVDFDALGFAIIDEQHKFGVDQRDRLLEKGRDPHLLSMTATPIPRSLAHSAFGDLDLAVIREKPPGRKPVRTFLRERPAATDVYEYVRERIQTTGEQAYFVHPLVEPSEDVPTRRSAVGAAERLANGPLAEVRVAVLHGRMDDEAKNRTMQRFADGEIDVLCATTVVEVGMDVPNATMMIVESADVFGLSQLHQLRGRVGRAEAESICVLLTGYDVTAEARERLQSFSETGDGFDLAEKDLEIRGPGEFLGERQSGRAEFRFGDLVRDAELLEAARRDARRRILGDAASPDGPGDASRASPGASEP